MVLQDLTCVQLVDYDVRIAQPYSSYDDFDFIIPVGTSGDTYDRFCVRNAEVWQSISIIRKLWKNAWGNEFHADVPDYYLKKEDVHQYGVLNISL
jgi:NADH-quinone oxidoreductase subunit D